MLITLLLAKDAFSCRMCDALIKFVQQSRFLSLMLDDEGRHTLDRLKQLVERGTYNQLADAIIRMSKKQKKEPAPIIKILEQLEDLDSRYGQPQPEMTTKQVALTTADIILSETFK